MMLTDENGECIETASNLKAKFEALRLLEEAESKKQEQQPAAAKKFAPKRFKVGTTMDLESPWSRLRDSSSGECVRRATYS